VAARCWRSVAQGVLEDVQHRRRRQVADRGQRVPGDLDRVPGEVESRLERLDDLGPAGVADPPADVAEREAVGVEEAVDVLTDVAPDHLGHG
jgi:hypothetical protein